MSLQQIRRYAVSEGVVCTGVALYAPDMLASAVGVCACSLLIIITRIYAMVREAQQGQSIE